MANRSVRIEELRLRVSGVAPGDAKRLGELVVKKLAGELNSLRSGKIAELKVHLEGQQALTLEETATQIAGSIKRHCS
jgi:hypothetical protein